MGRKCLSRRCPVCPRRARFALRRSGWGGRDCRPNRVRSIRILPVSAQSTSAVFPPVAPARKETRKRTRTARTRQPLILSCPPEGDQHRHALFPAGGHRIRRGLHQSAFDHKPLERHASGRRHEASSKTLYLRDLSALSGPTSHRTPATGHRLSRTGPAPSASGPNLPVRPGQNW